MQTKIAINKEPFCARKKYTESPINKSLRIKPFGLQNRRKRDVEKELAPTRGSVIQDRFSEVVIR